MKNIYEYDLSNSQIIEFIEKYTKDEKIRGILKDKILNGFINEDIEIKYSIFGIKSYIKISKILLDFYNWLQGEINNERALQEAPRSEGSRTRARRLAAGAGGLGRLGRQ